MNFDNPLEAVEALEKEEYAKGLEEGISAGRQKSWDTGFVSGWQQACHIHQELGRIEGILTSVLLNCESSITPRMQSQISKLLGSIRDWPKWNPREEDKLEARLATIHGKSRFILQQLSISSSVVDRSVDAEF